MTGRHFTAMGVSGHQKLTVMPGPSLLRGIDEGPTLDAHRRVHGGLMQPTAHELIRLTEVSMLRGRGGAGFPFARKLTTVASSTKRSHVVVNISEGEPASFKDAALALTSPHLILDGAVATARALSARTVHVIVPGESASVAAAIRRAVDERGREKVKWQFHTASPRFVAGQSQAVVELMSGRENLPVTSWQPDAVRGYRNQPTLLSNAETFAQVGALLTAGPTSYADHGNAETPGTTLLTLAGDGPTPLVLEVPHGTPWAEVLGDDIAQPVLLGGFHGVWARPRQLVGLTVDRDEMASRGLALGAGVVLPLPDGECPLRRTALITSYLAGQSAQRCGPCLNGLPALADAVRELDAGYPSQARAAQLVQLVTRRGACAHPDGTARLVTSMLTAFDEEPGVHAAGSCSFAQPSRSRPHEQLGAVR
jgi:NADH:ubiquinone oxidoreductase subunit F (NADH-binding)